MTTIDPRTHAAILASDAAQARAAAEASVITESCETAPLSYDAMRAAHDAGTLAGLLAELPEHLVRPQAVRFLVERRAATGALWGWGDVDDVERRFRRVIDAERREQLARRIGQAQAAALARAFHQAAPEPIPTPEPTPPAPMLTPTPSQVEAALLTREEAEARAERYARDAGDAEAAKLAHRAAQACRDALALLLDGAYRVTSAGDLLVRSPRGIWHRVGRAPAGGGEYSPVVCSCEWGQRGNPAAGPCKHQALYEAFDAAADAQEGGDPREVVEHAA